MFWKYGQNNNVCWGIWWKKLLTRINQQMVTYIIGIFPFFNEAKKFVWSSPQIKKCFLSEVKQKFATSKNSIPSLISNGASLSDNTGHCLSTHLVRFFYKTELELAFNCREYKNLIDISRVSPSLAFSSLPQAAADITSASHTTHTMHGINPYSAEICLYKPWRTKGFFNFKSS